MNQPNRSVPDLPPRRPLPPDVRERMRRAVLSDPVRGNAVRAPLAAAAAVAVLAAGGAIIAQSTQGDTIAVAPPSTTSPTSGSRLPPDTPVTSVSPGATATDAARCGFGDADVRFTLGMAGRRILVTRDDRFCELTHTTVSNNNPEVGPVPFAGGTAAVLWRSGSGVLIGRAPAGTSGVRLESGDPTGTGPMPVSLVEELFLTRYTTPGMSAHFTTPSGPVAAGIDVVALPTVQVWAAPREELPPGDPDVARCLNLTLLDGATWVGDPLKWRPGAFAGPAEHTWLVIHDQAGGTAYCAVDRGRMDRARLGDPTPPDGALVKVRYAASDGRGPTDASLVLAGTVDAAKVGGIEITDSEGHTVSAALRDGTFAVLLGNQPPGDNTTDTRDLRAKVLDHENRVIATVPM